MQDWALHSDNTGGYFQCNRFNSGANDSNNSNRENSFDALEGDGDIWAEERGNAHAETMRSRERNRRMSRFIHHYTRYQAHGQSYTMESRMQKDTLKRITEALKATREGKLTWLQGSTVPIPFTTDPAANPAESDQLKAGGETTALTPESLHNNIKKHFIATDLSLEFLINGFEELIKARKVITFPFSLFLFIFLLFFSSIVS
jgi:hypothetical protein